MIKQDDIYASYILPFRIVENLGVKCGYEKSVKLSEQKLLRNRYLLGINKADLDGDKLAYICQQLKIPNNLLEIFYKNIEGANLVLLGFEQGSDDCTYKLYLEYWNRIKNDISMEHSLKQPATMFLGFKWDAFDSKRTVVTQYKYYPMLSLDNILARIRELYPHADQGVEREFVQEIINHSVSRAGAKSLRYLEATEGDNPRKSFDINLYKAAFKLGDIYPLLERLCRHYSISRDELDSLFGQVNSDMLGHLSGGVDREGKSFVTVYYEAINH